MLVFAAVWVRHEAHSEKLAGTLEPEDREESRSMWNQFSVDILIQDGRFGLRMLRKSPSFTAVAVLTLALGIGANTAIFSVINGVLLRPLPYQEPGQLVRIFGVWPTQPSFPNSPADFVDYRARNHVFNKFAVFVRQDLDFTAKEQPLRLKGMGVSSEFFSVLGWHPLLGRDFSPAEETRGSNQVVILSHAVWQNVDEVARKSGANRCRRAKQSMCGRHSPCCH